MTIGSNFCRLLPALIAALAALQVQAYELGARTMRFARLGMDEGLSQSAVNQVIQDRAGFMWFATENGLDRFDGYRFLSFRNDYADPNSLPADFVTDLALDVNGALWVATDGGGLARRLPGRRNFDRYQAVPGEPASLPHNSLRRVLADPRGWVWIGSMRHGLSRLAPATGKYVHYRHDAGNPASLSDDRIYSLWLDGDGTLWIGTGAGVDRLDTRSGIIERLPAGGLETARTGDNRVLTIFRDSRETLWIGTVRGGLGRYDESGKRFRMYRHDGDDRTSLASDRVEKIYEDSEGRLWVGTSEGLHLMDRDAGTFTRYQHAPADRSSLSDSYVISMFEDRGGVLWVGTKTGGVNKWNSRSWLMGHYRTPASGVDGGSRSNVTAFTHDQRGRLWVGTFGGGIGVFDSGEGWTQLTSEDGLSDDTVMALATGADGVVWAGTMQGGLNRIEVTSGDVDVYRHDPADPASLAADGVMSLHVARDGILWVGTYGGGVSRYDAESAQFVNYPHDPADPASLSSPNATAIAEDSDGDIWVGTSSGGVNRLDVESGTWSHFRHGATDPHSLSSQAIYAIHVDAKGRVWIGTRGGLNRFAPGAAAGQDSFAHITQKEGLANNVVYGIRSTASGRLWLSTNYGISCYDPASGKIRNFHVSDGLQGEEFNFGAHHTGPDGTLYFGGSNGFNAFDPTLLDYAGAAPAVALTGFNKLNRPVDTDHAYEVLDRIELDYTDDMVSFEFAALDYAAPAQNRYAYKLEGFDDGWVNAGSLRRATYTDLPGGKYVFRVKAANSDGIWNDAGIALDVNVDRPPWLTWWAYSGFLLLSVGAIMSAYRRQKRKLEREEEYSRRLESEVRDRTHELAERNIELEHLNDRLREASLTDALTGLRNRRYLFEQISKDIDLVRRHYDEGRQMSDRNNDIVFVMVDLDNFKPVNDSCGHVAGDRMLLQVRDALLSACRSSDVVIRWGGDEFLIVGRESTDEEASSLAERIRQRIAQSVFAVGNGQIARTTCSIGFAGYPFIREKPDLVGWEQVLGIADVALFRAKQERNGWSGIHGVSWEGSGEALFQALQSDACGVEEAGHVRIESSLSLADSKTA